ncbi:polysaccharide biosynthesis/export family protein [candidate division WOR-3 bacterium]|nr:polysaccharide biosynthesis/export family protein [candidate division WOR-3 bacterium]
MLCLIFAVVTFSNDICLQPYDAVEITIWRQEDLSGRYFVDDDTTLTIPLFGKFSVKDIALDSLYEFLFDEFQQFYTDVPIDINFYYRINIFGEVKIPGDYYVRSEDNLANLLAQAGGPTNDGSLNNIRIINVGVERRIDFKKAIKNEADMEKLALRPGDIVIVPRRFMGAFQEWGVLFSLGTLILQIYIAAR